MGLQIQLKNEIILNFCIMGFYKTILSFMYFSNSFLFTSFFLPTNSTKGHFGIFINSESLFCPMLLYSEASTIVRAAFSQIGIISFIQSPNFSIIKIISLEQNTCVCKKYALLILRNFLRSV